MRLHELLAKLGEQELEALSHEHLGDQSVRNRGELLVLLEGVLKSPAFLADLVTNRFPPAFLICEALLDAPSLSLSVADLRSRVDFAAVGLRRHVDEGEVVAREEHLGLYRRVLLEVRRADAKVDSSEAAVLAVLRRELGIRDAEHFLIEHHTDFDHLWRVEHGFDREYAAMRQAGVIYEVDNLAVIPEELEVPLRHVVGLAAPTDRTRTLLGLLTNAALARTLTVFGLKSSGMKDDKVNRLIWNRVGVPDVLSTCSLEELRALCVQCDLSTSGSKPALVDRVASHSRGDQPLVRTDELTEADDIVVEPKRLNQEQFRALMSGLSGHQLMELLEWCGASRTTGTKEQKGELLWAQPFAESSLLAQLRNWELEDLLLQHSLRIAGSKQERISRILQKVESDASS